MTEHAIDLSAYGATVWALGATGLLMLVQAIVASMVAMFRGHVPGTPVPADHDDLLFRATRAQANMNETVAAFIVLLAFALARGVAPGMLAAAAWTWVAARAAHSLCYWLDWRPLRSTAFGVSLLALLWLAGLGVKG